MSKISTSTNIDWIQVQEQGAAPETPDAGYGRVYAKSDGLYFVGDNGTEIGPLASASGAGAMTLITDTVLGSPAASITFSSISGSYKHLLILGNIRTDRTGAYADGLVIQFNSDTGANYVQLRAQHNVNTTAYSENLGTATPQLSFILPSADSPANSFGPVKITIPSYAVTNMHKSALAESWGYQKAGTGSLFVSQGGIMWLNTAAITDIVFKPNTGTNFVAGSRLTLYGIN